MKNQSLNLVQSMKHDQIADWCAIRIRSMGYKFTCSNLTSAMHGEQPDVLGLDSMGESIVIEVKVSRPDFFADKKKHWRKDSKSGMGDRRVYLTPKGLLKPEEIPYGWMLWEVHGKTKPFLKIIKGKKKYIEKDPNFGWSRTKWEYLNCDRDEYFHFTEKFKEKKCRVELSWVLKVISRAMDEGFEPNNYANNYQLSNGQNNREAEHG